MESLPEHVTSDDLRKLADAMDDSGFHQWPLADVPERARRWLERIAEDGGLPGRRDLRVREGHLRTSDVEDPWNDPASDSVRAAKLKNGDRVFLKEASKRSFGGYHSIRIVDRPSRMEKALLAVLFVMEGRSASPDSVRETLDKCTDEWFIEFPSDDPPSEVLEEEKAEYLIAHVVNLLRYFRPDFDGLSQTEQFALIVGACNRTSEFLETLRKLIAFLEYGAGGRDTRPSVERAARDVEAAVLRDVDGLTHREIAERMRVEVSQTAAAEGDYSTVRKMTERGKKILEQGWGEAGWREKAVAMKEQAESWRALDPKQRVAERLAEALDTTPERARRLLGDGEEPSRGSLEDLTVEIFKSWYEMPAGIQ